MVPPVARTTTPALRAGATAVDAPGAGPIEEAGDVEVEIGVLVTALAGVVAAWLVAGVSAGVAAADSAAAADEAAGAVAAGDVAEGDVAAGMVAALVDAAAALAA